MGSAKGSIAISAVALLFGIVVILNSEKITSGLGRMGGLFIFPRKSYTVLLIIASIMMIIGGIRGLIHAL